MKMHLGLAVLACILVFGCNGTKQNGAPVVAPTTTKQNSSPGAAVTLEDRKCHGPGVGNPSVECKITITLNLKALTSNSQATAKPEATVKKVDDNHPGNGATIPPIPQADTSTISLKDVKLVGQILYTSASPGCIYFYYAGDWWYICE